MRNVESRLSRLEAEALMSPTAAARAEEWSAGLLAKAGLSKDEALERYRTWPAFIHALVVAPAVSPEADPDGLSAQDRYMRMLEGRPRSSGGARYGSA